MSCSDVGAVFFLDDDTVRTWFRLYGEDRIEGLAGFGYEGSTCQLSVEQQERLKSWIAETLPRTTRHVGAWIEQQFGIVYPRESTGLIGSDPADWKIRQYPRDHCLGWPCADDGAIGMGESIVSPPFPPCAGDLRS